MELCYSKTFIDVVADASSVVRSQSTPPRKLGDFAKAVPKKTNYAGLISSHGSFERKLFDGRAKPSTDPHSLDEIMALDVLHENAKTRLQVFGLQQRSEQISSVGTWQSPNSLQTSERQVIGVSPSVGSAGHPEICWRPCECDLPGASAVLQLLQSEISIRSHPVPPPSRKTPGTIRFALRKMTLANLVSLICSIMTHRRFGKLMFSELENVRKTAVMLGV
eukprot:Skav216415  [mRNA]  locus=scaffold457:573181:578386:+ [translate_table: standard]